MSDDITIIQRLLQANGHDQLAGYLEGAVGEIEPTERPGVALYIIYAEVDAFMHLRRLTHAERQTLLECALELHPPTPNDLAIQGVEFRVLRQQPQAIGGGGGRDEVNPLRCFISYSVQDGEVASSLKRGLVARGLSVFLAHEDIRPAEEWQTAIDRNLAAAGVFIPLITQHFRESEWTDQECGYAFAMGKRIIPICNGEHIPYGFLSRYQCHRHDLADSIEDTCDSVIEVLLGVESYRHHLVDGLIAHFGRSPSFQEASMRARHITRLNLNGPHIERLLDVALDNNQIYKCWDAQEMLRDLVDGRRAHYLPQLAELDDLIGEPTFLTDEDAAG